MNTAVQDSTPNTIATITKWWQGIIEASTACLFGWAFRFPDVQEAVLIRIKCGTPLGEALDSFVEDKLVDLDARDINGFEESVEKIVDSAVDDALKNLDDDIDTAVANALGDIDEKVEDAVEEAFNKLAITDTVTRIIEGMAANKDHDLVRLIAHRVSELSKPGE